MGRGRPRGVARLERGDALFDGIAEPDALLKVGARLCAHTRGMLGAAERPQRAWVGCEGRGIVQRGQRVEWGRRVLGSALASPSFACSERSGATPASPQPPATPPPSSPPAPSSLPPPPPPLPSGLGGCGREPLTGAPDGSVWGRGGGGGGFAGLRSAALNGGGGQTARGSAVLKVPQPSPLGPPPGRGGRGGVERAVREPLFLALALSPHRRAAEGNTFFALHALGGGGSDDGGGQPRE